MCVSLPRTAAVASLLCILLSGCGKTLPRTHSQQESAPVAALSTSGAGGLVTRNTTRVGGADALTDAAAVALTAYPGLTPSTRPRAVVIADSGDWPAALAASVLSGAPLRAPLLYSEGGSLPAASAMALGTMRPSGALQLQGAQVILVGRAIAPPGYRPIALTGASPAALAVAVERLASRLRGHAPARLIVTAADAPPAMTTAAANLAAQTGTPILLVNRRSIPRATIRELAALDRQPGAEFGAGPAPRSLYVVGSDAVVSEAVAARLGRYGRVTRIGGATPVTSAIAIARFTDGSFGWGVQEPGHGLVFAAASRPLDGPGSAVLSASGDYGPLLLVPSPRRLGAALSSYVRDLQPGSPASGPVHGVYNHGWLIGDEQAIAASTQAQLDTMLEISPRPSTEPPTSEPAIPPQSTP